MTHWDNENGPHVPECDDARRMRGGPQADEEAQEAPAKSSSTDAEAKKAALAAKRADVRQRLEEASKKGKKKKGFLTPERKKKLRKLLMIKAAENLKNQQKQLDSERQNVLTKRVPACPNVDGIEDKAQLAKIYNDLFNQMLKLEEEKYDTNFVVSQKDAEISEITISVNDLRGKFVKPTLKKVSKYDNKFRKQNADGGESGAAAGGGGAKPKEDFRAKLKTVEKKNVMEVLESKQKNKADKPEWTKKADKDAAGGGARRASQASSKGGGASEADTVAKPPEPAPEEEEEEEEPEAAEEEEEEEE